MQGSVHRYDETGAGSVLLDDGREVPFSPDAFDGSGLLQVRIGQRLSLVVDDPLEPTVVHRAWIVGIGDDETIR